MTLINEIIKSDKDRLFIVDYDCLIIFTGDTDEDDKPFIRLGNWSDMPVSLIPIIENMTINQPMVSNTEKLSLAGI